MKFQVRRTIGDDDVPLISSALKTVDGEAKIDVDVPTRTIEIDSWLMPEEFFVAFDEADYDVILTDA
jgi:copper chaperone